MNKKSRLDTAQKKMSAKKFVKSFQTQKNGRTMEKKFFLSNKTSLLKSRPNKNDI